MNKFLFFIVLLTISCNKKWTEKESADFLNRCNQKKTKGISIDSESYNDFCLCLEQEAQKTNSSYQSFLSTDLPEINLDKIIKSCTHE